MSVIIRKAEIEDAPGLANVHINSWREAYKGILSDDFLDDRPLNFNSRLKMWRSILSKTQHITYLAEHDQYGVIGFAGAGKGRDERFNGYGEIFAIYLLKKFHGQGIGFKMLQECFRDLKNNDLSKVYLWVIDNNPTINFYERAAGVRCDYKKTETIGGREIIEIAYSWENI